VAATSAGLARASEPLHVAPFSMAGGSLLRLQQIVGNRAIQRLVQRHASSEGALDVSPEVERAIGRSRGGGHALDSATSTRMGRALNADFSGVRVHTGSEANALNHALSARAFTTGKDMYFRQGEYNPGSSAGRELLAHELTHVVQQDTGVARSPDDGDPVSGGCSGCSGGLGRSLQPKLTVGSPGDVYERDADRVARAFREWDQRSADSDSGAEGVRRQAAEEEKKEDALHPRPMDASVRRQPEEDKKDELPIHRAADALRAQAMTAEEEKSDHR
jgi:uncharacterized protein DUF4157